MKERTLIISLIILLVVIIISIIYTTVPRLELSGIENMTISYRKTYEEQGVILKNANTKYLNKIKTVSNFDNKKLGTYHIDYTLKLGARTLRKRRNIKVVDDVPPIIKLEGNQITNISINEEYKEPGYTAQDEYDGDITQKVEVTGNVDEKNYGEYIIKYKVKDNSNNITEMNRIVKVIDEEPPKIVCQSNYSAFKVNTKNIIGCKAEDNIDGNITEKIKVEGEYNTEKKGTYNIKYIVEDDSGNKNSIEHNIVIYEPIKRTTYVIINDETKIKDLLKRNGVAATIINPVEETKEYTEELKNDNYQSGIKIKNKIIKTSKELENYCNNNQIKYISIENKITQPQIDEIINNKDKIIININLNTDIKEINKIIVLLKELEYKFDIIENIK